METRGFLLEGRRAAGAGHDAVQVLEERGLWTTAVGAPGLVLTCEAGRLWVTMEGDAQDYVLEPGDRVHCARRGLLAVQALAPSRLSVAHAAPALGRTALQAAAL